MLGHQHPGGGKSNALPPDPLPPYSYCAVNCSTGQIVREVSELANPVITK